MVLWRLGEARDVVAVGFQPGTGSSTYRRSSTSRYGITVVRAGLSAWPLVVASRSFSQLAVVAVAAA
jgi:hypothetical protein